MVAIFHFQSRFFFYLFILIFLGVNITGCGDSMVFKAPESMASSKAPGAAVSKTPETMASKVQNETSTQKGSRGSKFRVLTCSADGTSVAENESVIIDYSNVSEGYIQINYTGSSQKVKLQLTTLQGSTYT